MSTLFATTDDTVEMPDRGAAPRLATQEQVVSLVKFHYAEDRVRKWTYERAGRVLNRLRKGARDDVNRAEVRAREQDEDGGVRMFSDPRAYERAEAAAYLAQAGADPAPEQLFLALSACVWTLNDFEARRLASYLVRVFKGEA